MSTEEPPPTPDEDEPRLGWMIRLFVLALILMPVAGVMIILIRTWLGLGDPAARGTPVVFPP